MLIFSQKDFKFFRFGLIIAEIGSVFTHLVPLEKAPKALKRVLLQRRMIFFPKRWPNKITSVCFLFALLMLVNLFPSQLFTIGPKHNKFVIKFLSVLF